jgi:hypothetical protein
MNGATDGNPKEHGTKDHIMDLLYSDTYLCCV